jgi:hypothetical protein
MTSFDEFMDEEPKAKQRKLPAQAPVEEPEPQPEEMQPEPGGPQPGSPEERDALSAGPSASQITDAVNTPITRPLERPTSESILESNLSPFDRFMGPETGTSFDDFMGPARSKSVEEHLLGLGDRVVQSVSDAVDLLFESPLGLSEDAIAPFVAQTPEQATGIMGTVRTFNRVVLETLGVAGDVVLRATMAPIVGGVAAVSETARSLGMSETWANRLERDLFALALSMGIVSATPVAASRMTAFRQAARERIATAEGVQPGARAKMADAFDGGVAVGKREMGDAAGVPRTSVPQPLNKDIIAAAEELLTTGGVKRDPKLKLSDQIADLLDNEAVTFEQVDALLQKHKLTPDDFTALWRSDISEAARKMQTLSAAERRLRSLDPNYKPGTPEPARTWWKRVDDARRGLMVSQLATAIRNGLTQAGRAGLDVVQQALDNFLRQTFQPGRPRTAHPVDEFAVIAKIWQGFGLKGQASRKEFIALVDQVLDPKRFPQERRELFNNLLGDVQTTATRDAWRMFFEGKGKGGIASKGKLDSGLNRLEGLTSLLNIQNRFQEFVFRRAAFMARLDSELAQRGMSLETIIAKNDFKALTSDAGHEAVKAAVAEALDMTWGRGFAPGASGAEGIAGNFIGFINKMPGATLAIPFPRFMMNSVKYLYEFSPLGFLRLASPSMRKRVAAGDMSAISRATIGTAILGGAYQLRNSKWAGEKWYEVKVGGTTYDMRPFNPFAASLFVADVITRSQNGTLDKLTLKDFTTGVLSVQARAGTGVFMIDTLLDGIAQLEFSEKGLRALQEMAGGALSGFAVPFNQVANFFGGMQQMLGNEEEFSTVRSGREGPTPGGLINLGPVMRGMPFLKDTLPPVYSPLREGTMKSSNPMLRFFGLSTTAPKNPVESELDRLGVQRGEYFSSFGDPMADRMVAAEMGPLVERDLVPFVTSPEYKAAHTAVQAFMLIRVLQGLRNAAKNIVAGREPGLAAKLRYEGVPKRQRDMLNAITNGEYERAFDAMGVGTEPMASDNAPNSDAADDSETAVSRTNTEPNRASKPSSDDASQPSRFDALASAVKMVESGGDPSAVSPKGAVGTFQTMPATLRDPGFGIIPASDPSDPAEQERVGRQYLAAMLARYDGSLDFALAAYNWGPGNADRWIAAGADRSKLPKETRDYLRKVRSQLTKDF